MICLFSLKKINDDALQIDHSVLHWNWVKLRFLFLNRFFFSSSFVRSVESKMNVFVWFSVSKIYCKKKEKKTAETAAAKKKTANVDKFALKRLNEKQRKKKTSSSHKKSRRNKINEDQAKQTKWNQKQKKRKQKKSWNEWSRDR